MKQYRPSYYKDFRCIASACKDNCCIGWEIDIDEKTAAFYRGVEGPFGCRLKENILRDEEGCHFILKGERCPFLNEQNLCDIYSTLGEGALCEICDQHPRYHEWFGERKESGVGFCCEAAGRLIFSQEEVYSFESVDIGEEADPVDEEGFAALCAARQLAFELVDWGRYDLLLDLGKELQPLVDEEDWPAVHELVEHFDEADYPHEADGVDLTTLQQLLHFLQQLEPIDPSWPTRLDDISQCLPELLDRREQLRNVYPASEKNKKQLAVTFLFRYFCKALFDGDCRSPIWVTGVALLLVILLDLEVLERKGSFTLEDQVQCAKAFSKEIEYCSENLDALRDCCWDLFAEEEEGFRSLLSLL